MKIQVGKTYKDGNGRKVKIVVNLDKDMPGYPAGYTFIGQNDGGVIKAYNSEGKAPWVNNDKEHLLPNTVKKEGWTVVEPGKTTEWPGTFCQLALMSLHTAERVFNNLYKKDGKSGVLVKVEWEEEDNS